MEFCARAPLSTTTGGAALLLQAESALHVTAGAGATSGLRPTAVQAKVAEPGLAGTGPAGEQAAVGAGGEGLAMHLVLPPPADALLAAPAAPEAPDAQPASLKKRSRTHSDHDEAGAVSWFLQATLQVLSCLV